jgi:esterase/lipase superfamily enzyme
MQRQHQRWYSPFLQRDMELLVFGHAGARVVAFPTSMGRFHDWEDRGLVGALHEPLESGRLQLFCVDSVDAESWYARTAAPAERVRRHVQYDHYLLTEVLPFSARLNPEPFLIVTGASFGAYHAVNFACRHPEMVSRVLGMSGLYDIRRFMDGHYDQEFYFNNPCDFLFGEHDPERLAALQRMDIILAIGGDDPSRPSNEHLSGILWSKGVWHALRVWDGWAHDWPYWKKMLTLYIGGHD